MKKKMNKELSARIKADGSTQDEAALSVRRHNTKPNVTCSQIYPPYKPHNTLKMALNFRKWLLENSGLYREVKP